MTEAVPVGEDCFFRRPSGYAVPSECEAHREVVGARVGIEVARGLRAERVFVGKPTTFQTRGFVAAVNCVAGAEQIIDRQEKGKARMRVAVDKARAVRGGIDAAVEAAKVERFGERYV